MRALVASILLLMLGGPAHAQLDPTYWEEPGLFPRVPSRVDPLFIGYFDYCGSTPLSRPVRLRQTEEGWDLELHNEQPLLCGVPAGPVGTLRLVRLPEELRGVSVRVRTTQGPSHSVGIDKRVAIRPVEIPPSIAGAWHDPSLARQGVQFSVTTNGILAVVTTYDSTGKPEWLTGLGQRLQGDVRRLRFPLYRSTPEGSTAAGEADFEYLGCGRIRWNGRELRQYLIDANHFCDHERFAREAFFEVEYIDPQVERLVLATPASISIATNARESR